MHSAQTSFLTLPKREERFKTFVQKVVCQGGEMHLVKTYDHHARPCWFLLKANERSLIKLQHTSFEEMIDLTQFGDVIASGWGHKSA